MPHDISVPYTEDELENLKSRFRALPTYGRDEVDEYVLKSDMGELAKVMDYGSTAKQFAQFEDFIDKHFGGKIHLGFCIDSCRNAHDTAKLALVEAKHFDTDGDGFISEDEFKSIIPILCEHDAKLKITFEDFVAQADANRDGKVSIEECSNWIKSQLSNST